jgi:hypothetical protein
VRKRLLPYRGGSGRNVQERRSQIEAETDGAREPSGRARCGRGEHGSRPVEEEHDLRVGASLTRHRLVNDGLCSGEREEADGEDAEPGRKPGERPGGAKPDRFANPARTTLASEGGQRGDDYHEARRAAERGQEGKAHERRR